MQSYPQPPHSKNKIGQLLEARLLLKPGSGAKLQDWFSTLKSYYEVAITQGTAESQMELCMVFIQIMPELSNDEQRTMLDTIVPWLQRLATGTAAPSAKPIASAWYYLGLLFAHHNTIALRCWEEVNEKGKKLMRPNYEKAYSMFMSGAKNSHAQASYETAYYMEHGKGTRKQLKVAFQYYLKASKLGSADASLRLYKAYIHGAFGQPRSIKQGLEYLRLASLQGHPDATLELSSLYETGLSPFIEQDPSHALHLLKQVISKKIPTALFRMGYAYEKGELGLSIHPRLSLHFYLQAAHLAHPESCYRASLWYFHGEEEDKLPRIPSEAFSSKSSLILSSLSISEELQGEVEGMPDESNMEAELDFPEHLEPVVQDTKVGFGWLLRAAEMGLPKAMHALGHCYENGVGVAVNKDLAHTWYSKAAQHGDQLAVDRLQETIGERTGSKRDSAIPTDFFKKDRKKFYQKPFKKST